MILHNNNTIIDYIECNARQSPDMTNKVKELLREAARLYRYLPTNRRENYDYHQKIFELEKMLDDIQKSLCFAWEAK